MIGNPKKIRGSQIKEGFSAHREEFLKNKANNIMPTHTSDSLLVKKQATIPSKMSYGK